MKNSGCTKSKSGCTQTTRQTQGNSHVKIELPSLPHKAERMCLFFACVYKSYQEKQVLVKKEKMDNQRDIHVTSNKISKRHNSAKLGCYKNKKIRVGRKYQAKVLQFDPRSRLQGKTSEGRLVWDPYRLPASTVDAFLQYCKVVARHNDICVEKALRLLASCDYRVGDAAREVKENVNRIVKKHRSLIEKIEDVDLFDDEFEHYEVPQNIKQYLKTRKEKLEMENKRTEEEIVKLLKNIQVSKKQLLHQLTNMKEKIDKTTNNIVLGKPIVNMDAYKKIKEQATIALQRDSVELKRLIKEEKDRIVKRIQELEELTKNELLKASSKPADIEKENERPPSTNDTNATKTQMCNNTKMATSNGNTQILASMWKYFQPSGNHLPVNNALNPNPMQCLYPNKNGHLPVIPFMMNLLPSTVQHHVHNSVKTVKYKLLPKKVSAQHQIPNWLMQTEDTRSGQGSL